MLRLRVTTLGLAALLIILSGCGSDEEPPTPPPPTPVDLVQQLIKAAQTGDIPLLLTLLADDAASQTGDAWLLFIQRTASDQMQELAGPQARELRALSDKPTKEFMESMYTLAPQAMARLFSFYMQTEQSTLEEDGRVLAAMYNADNKPVYLAMARQADGSLRLLGEAATKEVQAKLARKLQENMARPAETNP